MDCMDEIKGKADRHHLQRRTYKTMMCKCGIRAKYTYAVAVAGPGKFNIKAVLKYSYGYHGNCPENQVYVCGNHTFWRWYKHLTPIARTELEVKNLITYENGVLMPLEIINLQKQARRR